MLFFRGEEQVDAWCEANGLPRRPVVTLDQLWRLSVAWYANRLDPDPPRRSSEEMRRMFADVDLRERFWDPEAAEAEQ